MRKDSWIIPVAIVAAGFALAGWFIGQGFVRGRMADRVVSVKGLAERDALADLALWPIRFASTDNNLAEAQRKIEESKQAVLQFLQSNGIPREQVELQGLQVNDLLTNPYRSGPMDSRYIINATLMVRSENPQQIQATSQKTNELVQAGVVLSSNEGPTAGPTYLFTRLNDLKPDMIAEATANARRAAEQFAKDSGSHLGKIRNANQGTFVILPRDNAPGVMEENQLQKTVRVVATIEYYLAD
jgi:uncharacterized protein